MEAGALDGLVVTETCTGQGRQGCNRFGDAVEGLDTLGNDDDEGGADEQADSKVGDELETVLGEMELERDVSCQEGCHQHGDAEQDEAEEGIHAAGTGSEVRPDEGSDVGSDVCDQSSPRERWE